MKKKTICRFISLGLCLVLALGLTAGCGKKKDGSDSGAASGASVKVTLNEVAHSIFYAPMYVAIEEGYFEQEGIDLTLTLDQARCCVDIRAAVRCDGRTGVEMEALTAVSAAALTVYDMCKAVQRDMVISDVRLLEKTGGVHGDFTREEN